MGGMAASGGYYIALGADTIIANPGSATGSIGVIMTYPIVEELMNKLGIGQETIKSTILKDAGSVFKELNDKERKYFQKLIREFVPNILKLTDKNYFLTKKIHYYYPQGKITMIDLKLSV